MNRELALRVRIKVFSLIFIAGLIFSGVTAIPLPGEVDCLVKITNAQAIAQNPGSSSPPGWALWLIKVQTALHQVSSKNRFLFYGTDWLAFGHFIIAVAFVGALRDPIRNKWLFTFGMIASVLVIPYALVFGAIRGIPFWWRLIDCSFGVFGIIPLWLCRKWTEDLERLSNRAGATGT